ncbi:MAG TPA: hypothetical protein V6D17_11245, partial [Candidatus Obscuribacterales bacterium]
MGVGDPNQRDVPAAGDVGTPYGEYPQEQGVFNDYVLPMERANSPVTTQPDATRLRLDQGYDATLGYDRIATGDTELSKRIDYITNLLAMGENTALQPQGLQMASRYYTTAIRQADETFTQLGTEIAQKRPEFARALQQEQDPNRRHEILFQAIGAERQDLRARIQQEQDPQRKQQLMQAEMDLQTIQRAPGFTRANYGLLLMRNGYYNPQNPQDPALKALREAVAKDKTLIPDPQSADPLRRLGDPNFMRVVSDITGMQPGDPNLNRVLQPIFGPDFQLPPTTYDPRKQQGVTEDVRAIEDPRRQQGPPQGDPRLENVPRDPAGDGTPKLDAPPQGEPTRMVNGKTPLQRIAELVQAALQQGLTQPIREAFAAAINDSDKGVSPRVPELQKQIGQIDARMKEIEQQAEQLH